MQGITNLSASAAYDASHREYAWTGFQVNREVVVMLPRTFVAGYSSMKVVTYMMPIERLLK